MQGRITLRIPKDLHAKLVMIAKHEGTSLNAIISHALSYELGRQTALRTRVNAKRKRRK